MKLTSLKDLKKLQKQMKPSVLNQLKRAFPNNTKFTAREAAESLVAPEQLMQDNFSWRMETSFREKQLQKLEDKNLVARVDAHFWQIIA